MFAWRARSTDAAEANEAAPQRKKKIAMRVVVVGEVDIDVAV